MFFHFRRRSCKTVSMEMASENGKQKRPVLKQDKSCNLLMNHPFPKSQHSLALYAGNTSAPTILPQSGRLPHSRSEGNFRTGSVAAFFQPGNASLLQESQPYFLRHSVLHSIIHSFQKKSSLFLKFYNLYDRINLQLADKRRILQKRGRLFHGSF